MIRKILLLFCVGMVFTMGLSGCQRRAAESPSSASSGAQDPAPENPSSEVSVSASSESTKPSEEDTAPAGEADKEIDLFSLYRAEAEQIAAQLTTEEKVWQVFLAAIPAGVDAAVFAQEHPAGGYLLFRWDFEELDTQGVREKMAALSAGSIRPLLAVDEEGGEIVRVSWYPVLREERFPAPSVLWAQGGADAVYGDAFEKGQFLASLGINLCLAPVADVSQDPNDYIYSRTIGGNAQETGWYVSAAVKGLQEAGVGAVLKHFPGYGNNVNTHTGIAVDERPLAQFESEDLLPFAAGIEARCGSVLVSHNIVNAFDSEYPASLSEPVHTYLREEMGFSGLVMTDDLQMGAATQYTGADTPAVAALKAGNDFLVHSDAESGVQEVLDALENGSLDAAVIDRAAEQVLAYKLWLGILDTPGEAG